MGSSLGDHLETISPASKMESSPVSGSESHSTSVPSPASVDTPEDFETDRMKEKIEEHVNLGEGLSTPRPQNGESSDIASQIQQLHKRLAGIEMQNKVDRLLQEKDEQYQASAPPGFLIAPESQGMLQDLLLQGGQDQFRYLMHRYHYRRRSHLDSNDSDVPAKGYISSTIRVFEREIDRLKNTQESLDELWTDHQSLQKREAEWNQERHLLLERQAELESKAQVPLAESETNTDLNNTTGNDGLPLPEPATMEKSELVRADWISFRHIGPESRTEVFAIEILQGEPSVDWDLSQNLFYANRKHRQGPTAQQVNTKPRRAPTTLKSPSVSGQSPLPERIRINSTHILKILEKIDSENFSSDGSMVMIRPYKALAYYEDAIRESLHNLKVQFGNQEPEEERTDHTPEMRANTEGRTPMISVSEYLESKVTTSDKAESETEKDRSDESDEKEDPFTTSLLAYEHLQCLLEFMDGDIKKKTDYLVNCRTVVFSDLWYLFKQGEEVIDHNHRQVYRIISMSSPSHRVIPPWPVFRHGRRSEDEDEDQDMPLTLNCVYIDFDGKSLGPISRKVCIPRFDGEKPVTSLEVFPLRFAERINQQPGETTLRQKLTDRGKLFLSVTSIKHMHYNGWTLDTRDEVDSHVVVDFREAFTAQENVEKDWRPALETIIGQEPDEEKGTECDANCCRGENIHSDIYADTKRNREYMASLVPEDRRQEPSPVLLPRSLEDIDDLGSAFSDEDLLIMSYRVFGFVLRSRKWAQLDLTHLGLPQNSNTSGESDSSSNKSSDDSNRPETLTIEKDRKETAFDQLVLPGGHKEMVESLVAQHFRDKDAAMHQGKDDQKFDIVRGKGKGLIILLHGAPGVGKTSTAEGVAEMFEKPLFQITCGDLGITAPEVEKALEKNFTLANRWGCVLLLDEADVFLTSRDKTDFIRNGLVSVFLRVLEYYAGVLFLTTNRVGDFDEAFASRIHISLYYPQLTEDSTISIFKLNFKLIRHRFLSRGRNIEIDEPEILEFARTFFKSHYEKWNGRQIRNACQTALALAEYRAQGDRSQQVVNANAVVHLTKDDLIKVSKAYEQFVLYVHQVQGEDSTKHARRQKLRALEKDIFLDDTRNKNQAQPQMVPMSISPTPQQPMHPTPAPGAYAYPPQNAAGVPPQGIAFTYAPQGAYPQAHIPTPTNFGHQTGLQQGIPPGSPWPGYQQQPQPQPQQQQQYQQSPPPPDQQQYHQPMAQGQPAGYN